MRLALGVGKIDEIAFRQARRKLQHRAGDRDVVIASKLAEHFDRGVVDRGEVIG